MEEQPYRGNVRELRNLLERTALLCDGETISAAHVQEAIATGRQPHEAARAPRHTSTDLREIEREALRDLVAQHHGSRAELAHRLGISERSLYRKLKSLG